MGCDEDDNYETMAGKPDVPEHVQEAIRTAPGFGKGHGPLNHAHTVKA